MHIYSNGKDFNRNGLQLENLILLFYVIEKTLSKLNALFA